MKKAAIFGFYCTLGCSFGTVMTPHSRLWKTFQVSAKLGDVEKEARLYTETSKNCKTNESKLIRILVTKLINPSCVVGHCSIDLPFFDGFTLGTEICTILHPFYVLSSLSSHLKKTNFPSFDTVYGGCQKYTVLQHQQR